jgi:hypothetical protein
MSEHNVLEAIDRGRLQHRAGCAHLCSGWCLMIGFPSKGAVADFIVWLGANGFEHQEPVGPRPDKPSEGWSLHFR